MATADARGILQLGDKLQVGGPVRFEGNHPPDVASGAKLASPVDYLAEDRTDCRNYGNLQGLVEARQLFSKELRPGDVL